MIRRWWVYLSEVFLLGSRTGVSLLMYAGVTFLYQALLRRSPLALTPDLVPGAATLVLMFLYFRIQDEFKDRETDRQFFPGRPVPAGRVTFGDLRALMWVNFAALLAINLAWGRAIAMFLVFLGYSMLMHNWFFMEKAISQNRLLALATHGPFGFLANLFVVAVFAGRFGTRLLGAEGLLAALWFSWAGFYWDVARKTRAPQEEQPGYQTYSSMIGSRGSAALAFGFAAAQVLMLAWLPVSRAFCVFCGLCLLALGAVFLRFALMPGAGSRHLQRAAELFTAAVSAGIMVDLVAARGLQWMS